MTSFDTSRVLSAWLQIPDTAHLRARLGSAPPKPTIRHLPKILRHLLTPGNRARMPLFRHIVRHRGTSGHPDARDCEKSSRGQTCISLRIDLVEYADEADRLGGSGEARGAGAPARTSPTWWLLSIGTSRRWPRKRRTESAIFRRLSAEQGRKSDIMVRAPAMEHWKLHTPEGLSALQTNGLVVLSIALAVGGALFLDRYFARDVEVPLFLFAVAISAWYGRTSGAVLALVLSCLAFRLFFRSAFTHSVYFRFRFPLLRDLRGVRLAGHVVQRHSARGGRGTPAGPRPAGHGSDGTNSTGKSAEPHTRHHFRPRYERRDFLLESRRPGAVWVDCRRRPSESGRRSF